MIHPSIGSHHRTAQARRNLSKAVFTPAESGAWCQVSVVMASQSHSAFPNVKAARDRLGVDWSRMMRGGRGAGGLIDLPNFVAK
jgi:hypothetical protein